MAGERIAAIGGVTLGIIRGRVMVRVVRVVRVVCVVLGANLAILRLTGLQAREQRSEARQGRRRRSEAPGDPRQGPPKPAEARRTRTVMSGSRRDGTRRRRHTVERRLSRPWSIGQIVVGQRPRELGLIPGGQRAVVDH